MTGLILAAARAERHGRGSGTSVLRIGLVVIALAELTLAVSPLVFGSDEGAPVHVAHEVGAWDVALAVGFLFAAWRPLRAVGLLPFVAALAAGLVGTAVLDVMNRRAVALVETTHLLELVGALLLWLLTITPHRRRVRRALQLV